MNQIWDSTGPILIGAITVIILGILLFIIIRYSPDEVGGTIKRVAPYLIIIAFIASIYVASGQWSWR
ncbi:hypothetical protein [Paenibacillus sp. USDA918EY]|uniref:hypothetical protein n=1 Tax=Paenibacillus sp. USDA918EY TaxID=2689575 RepID=UPI00135C2482|nr:hypothetical protein [Paenibacillus sp. USDA918EY]